MTLYTLLAKSAAEAFVKERKIIRPPRDLPKRFFKEKSGAFVTIEKNGTLRGCIGTYLPTKRNIAQEIIHNAVAAAGRDYRFGPIQKEELPDLKYTVYILSEPEFVKDITELGPKEYGIIVKTVSINPHGDAGFNGHVPAKTGLLLPELEGINTPQRQIAVAAQKAGIDPKTEPVVIYRFTTKKYQ